MRFLKNISMVVLLFALLLSALSFPTFADGLQTCPKCSYTKNHADWKYCTNCGADLHVHTWKEATCTTPKTCTSCNAAEGSALGHSWKKATCTQKKTCTRCKKTEGGLASHTWVAASKSQPKHCSVCGKVEISVGERVFFGHYEQDNDKKNGKESVEWVALDVKGNEVLLLSVKGLDYQAYDIEGSAPTWDTCTLRTWLNGSFLASAFSSQEQKAITEKKVPADANSGCDSYQGNDTDDSVFLLSEREVGRYLRSANDRKCVMTEYAKAQLQANLRGSAYIFDTSEQCCKWWLRTAGGWGVNAAIVWEEYPYEVYPEGVHIWTNNTSAVRPAIWVNLSKM